MRRDEALRILAEHRAELAALKVKQLRLFGSVARDEAGPDSDVDLLVEFSEPIDLFDYGGVQQRLVELLGCPVDLVQEKALRPQLRASVTQDAILVTAPPLPTVVGDQYPVERLRRPGGLADGSSGYGADGERGSRPARVWRHYIEDMLTAATRIGAYTAGMTLADFEARAVTIDATLHNFVVMGEAAARVSQPIRDRAVDVPWGRIRGMRNVLVHRYEQADLTIVWETIVDDLPGSRIALQAILDREP